jgi:hypothetical protein
VACCAGSEEFLGQLFQTPMRGKAEQKRHYVWMNSYKNGAMKPLNTLSSAFALFSIITFITIVILMIGGFF